MSSTHLHILRHGAHQADRDLIGSFSPAKLVSSTHVVFYISTEDW